MRPIRVCVALLSLAASPSAAAQDPQSVAATLETMSRTIERQQQLLEEQGRQIDQLRNEIAAIRATAPPAGTQSPAAQTSSPAAAAAGQSPPVAESSQARVPELPPDLVSSSEFPGSFPIPGSDAALKIGGLVRVNWVSTYDAMLVDDRFQASAIPMPGTPEADRGGRVNIIASPSRFNFDLRTPTGVGYMRAFIEGDFAGSGNTLRVRHAYGQWRRWIYGQTWSTFSDPEAEPDGIDFEGLNAIVLFRQPQVRFSFAPGQRIRVALALEDPKPDVTGATGVNQIPDVVARLRWEPKVGGHIQFSTLARQLRAESDAASEIVSTGGFGISISGRLPFPYTGKRDQVLFQHNSGHGIGRYISDLGSLGGQDGVFDPTANSLRPLDVFSGYGGFEHWWTGTLRSAFSFGIVGVSNLDIQPDDALHLTRRSTVNFMWSPIPRLDLVTEFLWGRRVNKDGQSGFAAQTQIGSTFRF
jgi:hypothetical protein